MAKQEVGHTVDPSHWNQWTAEHLLTWEFGPAAPRDGAGGVYETVYFSPVAARTPLLTLIGTDTHVVVRRLPDGPEGSMRMTHYPNREAYEEARRELARRAVPLEDKTNG